MYKVKVLKLISAAKSAKSIDTAVKPIPIKNIRNILRNKIAEQKAKQEAEQEEAKETKETKKTKRDKIKHIVLKEIFTPEQKAEMAKTEEGGENDPVCHVRVLNPEIDHDEDGNAIEQQEIVLSEETIFKGDEDSIVNSEEPTVEEPTTDEPAIEEPTTDELTIDEPAATEESVTKKSSTKKSKKKSKK